MTDTALWVICCAILGKILTRNIPISEIALKSRIKKFYFLFVIFTINPSGDKNEEDHRHVDRGEDAVQFGRLFNSQWQNSCVLVSFKQYYTQGEFSYLSR